MIHISASEIFEREKVCGRGIQHVYRIVSSIGWKGVKRYLSCHHSWCHHHQHHQLRQKYVMRLNVFFFKYVTHFPFDLPINRVLINMKTVCLCTSAAVCICTFASWFSLNFSIHIIQFYYAETKMHHTFFLKKNKPKYSIRVHRFGSICLLNYNNNRAN